MKATDMTASAADDAGVDVESREWHPSPAQLARYHKREVYLARLNMAKLAATSAPRRKVTITNGREPFFGYGSIGVIVGGPDHEDTLHSLTTFGRAGGLACDDLAIMRAMGRV